MKSIVDRAPKAPTKYPYLGMSLNADGSTHRVVLFNRKNSGVLLFTSENVGFSVGVYSEDWPEDFFKDLNGSITLQN